MKLLVADDDRDLLDLVAFALTQSGYIVVKAGDGRQALQGFDREQPDLAILDLNMPVLTGFEVCSRIREVSTIPILILTSRDEEEDLVRALDLGADDYLTKPFSPRTLLARVRALLRRAGQEAPAGSTSAAEGGRIALDPDELTVRIGDAAPVALTRLEHRLLQALLARAGGSLSSERLLVQVWGQRGAGDRQLLKQLVHRVRQKIEPDPSTPRHLVTTPTGYKLVAD